MGKAVEDLKAAFAGESQANRRYLAFAKAADQEGLAQVARLFRAAAEAETVHAHNHLRAMDGIGKTAENLKEAIAGETHEFTSMYPAFIIDAKADGHKKAQQSFTWANAVEKIHAGLYQRAAEAVGQGKDMAATPIYVCSECGNTVEGTAPEVCPVCGHRGTFKTVA